MTAKPDFVQLAALYEKNRERFERFYRLLTEYNQKYNLTAITEEKEVYYKHFLDSLAGVDHFPEDAHVAEVGSGAGFPSIPLMLAREDLSFTLIESTGKKCEFLKVAVRELGLKAEVLCMRAEDAGKNPLYREQFDVCCARAVARLVTLAEYCIPLVKKGGVFLAYKGDAAEETREAEKGIALLGGGAPELISYELPEGYGARTLVRVIKRKETPTGYPRGNGKERSRPLI